MESGVGGLGWAVAEGSWNVIPTGKGGLLYLYLGIVFSS